MMRTIVLNQKFHGIGQGLFYSAKISTQVDCAFRGEFNFIFDCGSLSARKYLIQEIGEYKKLLLRRNTIDLLIIISHLHSDHVNGLEQLLDDVEVNNLVLPYLYPAERALLSIISKGPKWYFDFLYSPTNFLKKRGVKNIIYVSRGEDFKSEPPISKENLNEEREYESKYKFDFDELLDDINTREKARGSGDDIDDSIIFKKDSKPARVHQLWNFYFYVSPIEENILDLFSNKVKELFEDLSFFEIIRNKDKRKTLRDIYEKYINQDLNFTSLACLHGPFNLFPSFDFRNELLPGYCHLPFFLPRSPFSKECRLTCAEFYDCWRHMLDDFKGFYKNRSYTFLTGDINSISEWEGFKKRYQQYFKYIHSFQIPHHGSKNNWNVEIPFDIGPSEYIISAGIHNKFRHPDIEVIQNLSQNLSPEIIKWAHCCPNVGIKIPRNINNIIKI